MTGNTPWGLRLMTDRLAVSPPLYARATLDPSTQTARYFDEVGQVVEMAGKHGSNKSRSTASMSGGSDGARPGAQTQDDTTTDYESD